MFEKIASVIGVRVWFKQPEWKRSRPFGLGCINLVRNGAGLKINFVFTNNDQQRVTIDMPLQAVAKILRVAKREGFDYNSLKKFRWKFVDWKKEREEKHEKKNMSRL